MAKDDIREVVDTLLGLHKTPEGIPNWHPGPRAEPEGQIRWSTPLAIDGEITPLKLLIDAYPREENLKFTLNVTHTVSVFRLDYGKFRSHVNKIPVPDGLTFGLISGNHAHYWQDNRHLATAKNLPKILEYAKITPAQVQGFANSFRWFCGEANIECGYDIPDLPTTDLLL